MGLGNNRDYKTRDRAARTNLKRHAVRMAELESQGMTREAASKQAFDELRKRKQDREFRNAFTPNKHGEYA
jgi:hypothetical protein